MSPPFTICFSAGTDFVLAASVHFASQAQPDDSETARPIKIHTLTNDSGVELRTMNYGGTILSLRVPNRDGALEDVVLGLVSTDEYCSEPYLSASPYFGAIIGRFGNRIEEGQFELDGQSHQLVTNHGSHHLHGGSVGFDKRFWTDHSFVDDEGPGIRYTYTSPEGEEGYPGRLTATVTYRLTEENALSVSYEASTTEATPVNLTQHTYFNLAGHDAPDVLDHQLMINADSFTPVDSSLIPTGELRPVEGTPFDFRTPTRIGARIDADNRQLEHAHGYDHNFVLNRNDKEDGSPALAARAYAPRSGRDLTVYTTDPGLQFYTGNSLSGSVPGKNGAVYDPRSGFCLETQHFPDSPNHPNFPSTILRPGETYCSRTIFSFSTRPPE